MEPTEKELEDRLRELGMRLASPPSDIDELLRLLDQIEIYLSRVEQSPSTSMSDALHPVKNSLITKEFLNHPETVVKVFVAACINEIIRVTAPDAPYNDALMKEIFAMIVDSFKKLDDMSGCLYSKRVSILEIMAKVRSCVVMLDLECDDLILHMFKHFLKSIRPDHPINVFSSMETIMTLILEESEDISPELLICLLSNVQKSKMGVMPVAGRLAGKVISNCSMKLKPYFLVAVQSMGTYLRDYSGVIASICQDSSIALEQTEADDKKLFEKTVSVELAQESEKLDKPVSCLEDVGGDFTDKTIKLLSHGVMPFGNGNAVIEPISPELKPENSFSSEQCRNDVAHRGENNSLGSIAEKPDNELDFQYIEAKSSSIQLTDITDSSRVDGDKEASAPTSRIARRKKQTKGLKSDSPSDMAPAAEAFMESERDTERQSLEGLVGDNTCANSAAPNSSPGSDLPIRRRVTNSQLCEKKSTSHKPALSEGKKKVSGITTVEKECPPAIVSEHKDHGLVSISDGIPPQDSAKKSLADNAAIEVAAAGISDEKPLRKEQKEAASVVADANTLKTQWNSNILRPKAKDVTYKDVSAEPCLKEMMVSSKASGEASNDQNNLMAPEANKIYLELIGREIEVLWPDDKMFYKGVIDAFDPVTEKHRVVYDDGDVEILLLRNERWNYVDSKNFGRGQDDDIASPKSSLHMSRKKHRASSRKRKATRQSRGKLGRKSKHIPIQQSDDGYFRQTTSEMGTSLNEKTTESLFKRNETKIEEPSQINNSDEPPIDTSIIKEESNITSRRFKRKNILSSGGGRSRVRVRRKGDSFRRKSKTRQNDEGGTDFESHHTKISLDDTPVDSITSTGSKLDEKSKHRRKPRGETSKISRIMNEETLKSPSEDDKGIIIESSQPDNDTAFKYDSITDTDVKLKEKDTVKLDNIVNEGAKARGKKRKGTVTTVNTNVSAIKNSDGLSERIVEKRNKRRRK